MGCAKQGGCHPAMRAHAEPRRRYLLAPSPVLVVARLEEEVVDLAEQEVQDACGHARAPHQRQRARPGVARTPAEVEGGRRGAPEIEAGLRTGSLKVECAAERTY